MEHHSNELPWRGRAQVVRAGLLPDGRLDEEHLDFLLARHAERVALLTVSGASNVTGFVQPVHRLAAKAHAVGARILVDAAQWAPHRPIDVRPADDPEHLDYIVAVRAQALRAVRHGRARRRPDVFLRGAPEYRAGAPSSASGSTRWSGPACPTVKRRAAPTWSVPSRPRRRMR